jgi:diadenosine tetraphosphate (Ap4A) HIT family hydrolase
MNHDPRTCMTTLFDLNPLTKIWCLVITSQILVSSFFECVKLAKLAIVHIIGNVEDEICFLMKSKFHNRLIVLI